MTTPCLRLQLKEQKKKRTLAGLCQGWTDQLKNNPTNLDKRPDCRIRFSMDLLEYRSLISFAS